MKDTETVAVNPAVMPRETEVSRVHDVRAAHAASELAGKVSIEAMTPDAAGWTKHWRFVNAALRGRWLWAGLVSAVGAAAAGMWVWHAVPPVYSSEGLVQIKLDMPSVSEQPNNNDINMFETFMQSQKTMIMSRKIVDAANKDPIWEKLHVAPPLTDDRYYAEHMVVDIKAQTELIDIIVNDRDGRMAAAAVTAVINAYADQYNSRIQDTDNRLIGALAERQTTLKQQEQDLSEAIQKEAADFGTTKLDAFAAAAQAEVARISMALNDINLALAGARNTPAAPGRGDGVGAVDTGNGNAAAAVARGAQELTPEQISIVDEQMRQNLDMQKRAQANLDQVAHLGENAPAVVTAKRQLAQATEYVNTYAQTYRQFHAATAQNLGDPSHASVNTVGMSVEQLKLSKASLEELLASQKKEMARLGTKQWKLEQLEKELQGAKEELSNLTKRLEVLQAQGTLGGRLSVINRGEVPVSPSKDQRRKLAPMAGFAGGLIPLGLVLVGSVVKKRYRYVDEAKEDASLSHVPLLAMLPEVKQRDEEELMTATAHGIHQMRVLLCSRAAGQEKQTYLLTSATQGEGKTSLTVALGMAYAATRRRTLLIDGDFVGRRLTQGFNAGESEGLAEVLRGATIRALAKPVSSNLDILPAGKVGTSGAWGLTAENMRSMLKQAREGYDTVLVDTGPILGSIEAAVLAQEVEGVIVTVARGQHPHLVEQAMRRLTGVGAKLSGVVFNRAKVHDFYGSSYTSTSAPYGGARATGVSDLDRPLAAFGPLPRAMALAAAGAV